MAKGQPYSEVNQGRKQIFVQCIGNLPVYVPAPLSCFPAVVVVVFSSWVPAVSSAIGSVSTTWAWTTGSLHLYGGPRIMLRKLNEYKAVVSSLTNAF